MISSIVIQIGSIIVVSQIALWLGVLLVCLREVRACERDRYTVSFQNCMFVFAA